MKKIFKNFSICILLLLIVASITGCSSTENKAANNSEKETSGYPKKDIEFIVPMSAGGGSDIFCRTLVNIIEKNNFSSKKFIIENKPGAAGSIGWSFVANDRKGDEYTIATTSASFYTGPAAGQSPVSYEDFTHIIGLVEDARVLAVNSSSNFNSVKDIVDYALQNPGKLSCGVRSGVSQDAILFYALKNKTNTDMVAVPFSSDGADTVTSLLGNHIDFLFCSYSEIMSQVDAGLIRVLAVGSEKRPEGKLSNIPTMKEEGYDVALTTVRGIVAPKGVSDEMVAYLADVFKKATQTDEWKEYVDSTGQMPRVVEGDEYYKLSKEGNDQVIQYLPLLEEAN